MSIAEIKARPLRKFEVSVVTEGGGMYHGIVTPLIDAEIIRTRLIRALELAIERHELSLELSEHAARAHFAATVKDIDKILGGRE